MYNNWLIHLDTIDSTNNYAMQLLQDGMAQHGQVVVANYQLAGKGQRGKQWLGDKDLNLAMSMILLPHNDIDIYFLSFCIPVAVQHCLSKLLPNCHVCIKWPNDILVNDRKLCGILIENIFRGAHIKSSVIGIGINMYQQQFDVSAAFPPTSINSIAPQFSLSNIEMASLLRSAILDTLQWDINLLQDRYNSILFRKNESHRFQSTLTTFEGKIQGTNAQFELEIATTNGEIQCFRFGEIQYMP
jgi:BirA family biotin operon repressor/biotin-[acetyl-CoA-carboxylase] ligase